MIAVLFAAGAGLGALAVVLLSHRGSSAPTRPTAAASPRAVTSSGLPAASAGVQTGRSSTSEAAGSPPTTTGAEATAAPLASGATASFKRLQAHLPGPIELAVRPVGEERVETFGGDRVAHGWSITKVPVLVALLSVKGAQGLSPTEKA